MTVPHISYNALCRTLLAEMRKNQGQLRAHVTSTVSSQAVDLDRTFSILSTAAAHQ